VEGVLSREDADWATGCAERVLATLKNRPMSDWPAVLAFTLATARLLGREDTQPKRSKR